MEGKEEGRIFVGGLSWQTDECKLQDAFGRFGKVVDAQAPSAGSNPTPSPPLGASPTQQGWPGYPTYPTQPFTWGPPPPQSQGYSSWPGAQTQQGPSAGLWRYDAAPSGWTQAPPQAGWGSWGDGTPGDGATS